LNFYQSSPYKKELNNDSEEDDTTILKGIHTSDFLQAILLEEQINKKHIVEYGYKTFFGATLKK